MATINIEKKNKLKVANTGCNPVCSILAQAGIPNNLNWRCLFNFLRTLDKNESFSEEQKKLFQAELQELIQNPNFADSHFNKTMARIEEIRHAKCRENEHSFSQKLKQLEKDYEDMKAMLGQVLRSYANIASLGIQLSQEKVDDIEHLKNTTVNALENEEDRQKIIDGVIKATDTMVKKINNEFATWKQKAQESEAWKQKAIEMEKLANIDSLTGLFNRRAFDHHIESMVKALLDKETFLSLMIIDIDHFKKFNDNFGHDVGDEVLKLVANMIKKNAKREGDFPARYGGEELILVCEGIDINKAKDIAEKIRKDIEEYKFIVKEPEPQMTQITVSIGISELDCCKLTNKPNNENEIQALVQQFIQSADKALYTAKKSGRNRVCSAI
ncbi:MAG: GGDEF domain-containing protein [Thermodesulfovibrionales bacterium]|nr:GGDEF domain-containing protein [Thermodesulfovibrionales bacterium]